MKTTIVAPDVELYDRAVWHARRFRALQHHMDGLSDVRKNHRDAVFLRAPDDSYEVHVWGDPEGHVRAYAFRVKK
jgi:hypothetical protein